MADEFLPKEYWREFEEFALRIVEIKIHDTIAFDHLYSWQTKETHDEGIDGQILLSISGADIKITVEAKLRKNGKLALKDIASSLINYLINSSDIHFVVTNVYFTQDAYRIADSINKYGIFSVNYLDCNAIISCFNEHPELERVFPVFAANIRSNAKRASIKSFDHSSNKENDSLLIDKYLSHSRQVAKEEIEHAIENGSTLTVLFGSRGTDKSLVLDHCIRELSSNYAIIHLDLQYIDTVRTFLLAVFKNVLGLDIFEYWSLYSEKNSVQLNNIVDSKIDNNALLALKGILNSHFNGEISDELYFIQEFFSEIAKQKKLKHLLILENVNLLTAETFSSIMNLFSKLADCGIQIILELSSSVPTSANYMDASIWFKQLDQIKDMRIKGKLTKWVILEDLTNQEAIDLVGNLTKQVTNDHLLETITLRFGNNPALLREICAEIEKRGIKTASEIANLPIPGSEDVLITHLLSTIQESYGISKEAFFSFRWCLQAIVLLQGNLGSSLISAIENHFFASGTEFIFKSLDFCYVTDEGFRLKSERERAAIEKVTKGWEKKELISFLRLHSDQWALPEVLSAYVSSYMLIKFSNDDYYVAANHAIDLCLKNGEDRRAASLIQLCKERTSHGIDSKTQYQHLRYSIDYLSLDIKIGLSDQSKQRDEANRIVTIATKMHIAFNMDSTAAFLIDSYLLRVSVLRNEYCVNKSEEDLYESISLAKDYNLFERGAKAYVAKALFVKENRSLEESFDVFRFGLKSYPNNHFLRACYLANYAAYLAKADASRAVKCGLVALSSAQKAKDNELICWIAEDIILYRIQSGEKASTLLPEIEKCRRLADKQGFRADISRTYNMEGVLLVLNGDKINAANRFRNSIYCYDPMVTDQQKFLFRNNLIASLPFGSPEWEACLSKQLEWIKNNQIQLNQKLTYRCNIAAETNYAALVCTLSALQQRRAKNSFLELQSFFSIAQLKKCKYSESIDLRNMLSSRFFPSKKKAFILF